MRCMRLTAGLAERSERIQTDVSTQWQRSARCIQDSCRSWFERQAELPSTNQRPPSTNKHVTVGMLPPASLQKLETITVSMRNWMPCRVEMRLRRGNESAGYRNWWLQMTYRRLAGRTTKFQNQSNPLSSRRKQACGYY